MPEDVLEWGSISEIAAHPRPPRRWDERVVVPPAAPYVLAGVGAVAYFVSLSQPWRLYHMEPTDAGGAGVSYSSFADRPEYAQSLGLGLGYIVTALALAALFPLVLMGSRRMKRAATGVVISAGVMCLAQLIAMVSVNGKDSVWYESSVGIHQTITAQPGLYASFVAVLFLVAASIATHYAGARRPRPVDDDEVAYDTDPVQDLTVTGA
jgi:hypothetical protein